MTNIRYVSSTDDTLNKLIELVDDAPDVLFDAVSQSVERTKNPFLAAVKGEPRPAVHPFIWSTDEAANNRARRWYFAAIARGDIRTDGSRYIRSGAFGESFDIVVLRDGDNIDAVFGTGFEAASYIVGNEDGSLQQIPGHATTGWFEFDVLAEVWADERIRETELAISRILEGR